MPARALPPPEPLRKLRAICLGLPEVQEQPAWAGIRWCIANKNFAHALTIEDGWPPAYAAAACVAGPAGVLTFRFDRRRTGAQRFERRPFFKPVWFDNIAGLLLDDETDWDEVEALVTESYAVLAPKRLRARLDRGGA